MQYFLYAFIGMNVFGFISMYLDKKRAIKHKQRIKEATLWKVALLGGAVGSSLGMKIFRHKTKHKLFVIGMPVLAFLYIFVLLFVVYSSSG